MCYSFPDVITELNEKGIVESFFVSELFYRLVSRQISEYHSCRVAGREVKQCENAERYAEQYRYQHYDTP